MIAITTSSSITVKAECVFRDAIFIFVLSVWSRIDPGLVFNRWDDGPGDLFPATNKLF
jgi:hypothetical protein